MRRALLALRAAVLALVAGIAGVKAADSPAQIVLHLAGSSTYCRPT